MNCIFSRKHFIMQTISIVFFSLYVKLECDESKRIIHWDILVMGHNITSKENNWCITNSFVDLTRYIFCILEPLFLYPFLFVTHNLIAWCDSFFVLVKIYDRFSHFDFCLNIFIRITSLYKMMLNFLFCE